MNLRKLVVFSSIQLVQINTNTLTGVSTWSLNFSRIRYGFFPGDKYQSKWILNCNNLISIKKASNSFLNDFVCFGVEGCQWTISETPSFCKWRNGGKILGQHSFYSNLLPPSLVCSAHWLPSCERAEWSRSGSTQCRSSYMKARQPPHAFLDHIVASHCLPGF